MAAFSESLTSLIYWTLPLSLSPFLAPSLPRSLYQTFSPSLAPPPWFTLSIRRRRCTRSQPRQRRRCSECLLRVSEIRVEWGRKGRVSLSLPIAFRTSRSHSREARRSRARVFCDPPLRVVYAVSGCVCVGLCAACVVCLSARSPRRGLGSVAAVTVSAAPRECKRQREKERACVRMLYTGACVQPITQVPVCNLFAPRPREG